MTFPKVREEVRYDGPFLTVVGATYEGPDGTTFQREFIRHPGAVAVVALTEDGREAILVRQFRAAVDRDLLEIPAGLLDVAGEAPEVAAARELEEEIGRRVVGPLEQLVDYVPAAGMADHHVVIYLCRTSEACEARPHGPEEQAMVIEHVALADVEDLIAKGEITDGKTIVGLLLAARS